ncbi:spermidine synthase [Piscinibacter sp.]|uniref:spermine/spermidine synthase domain-containing protein n=1 Tax=Piscinibacter sp. TaxID=1903157 RepID=UPI002B6F00EA|nr:spermidine synthase [Albitalea sp.]HUG24085.1 spermidine synthase [Albitalea sp.]
MKRDRTVVPELAPATMSEADGVRYLHLGTPWVQGAMRIRSPQSLELEYIQRMMAWMLFRPEGDVAKGHAVQLGLGAAAITRFCHGVLRMRTTAVELNPTVISACRLWFRLPDDGPKLQVLQQDAATFAADTDRAGSADVLCVDLYDQDAASPVLDSEAFYRDCRRLLADGGVMAVNLFGRDASFERSAQRIAAVFGEAQVRSLRPTKEGNTIVIACRAGALPERAVLAARAENIETRFKLPARKWLRMIRALPASTLPVA